MNSLRGKLAGIVVASLIVALGIYSALLHVNLKKIIVANQEEHLSSLAVASCREIAQWFEAKKTEMQTIADSISQAGSEKSVISRRLKLHAENNPRYEMLFYADLSGRAFTSSGFETNIHDRSYFRQVILTAMPVVSDPVISRQSQRPIVVIAAPVKKGARVAGILGCTIPLEYLSQLTSHIKPAKTGYVFVVQSDGMTIIHPETRLALKHNILMDPQIDPSLRTAVSNMVRRQAGIAKYAYENVDKYLAYAPIPGSGWSLAINAPVDDVLQQLSPVNKLIVITPIFVIILASALISFLLIVFILRPISSLRNIMAQVEGGDLDVRSDFDARDEIGQLAGSFNRMVQTVKLTTEKLRRSEGEYRSLFENAVEGFFRTTPEGRIVSANPALAQILGYSSPEELCEQNVDVGGQRYETASDRELFKDLIEKEGVVRAFETKLLKKDGTSIWVSLSARSVREKDDSAILYYEGNLEDITPRKEGESALIRSERRLAGIIDLLPDATFTIDREGRIIVWNRAIEEMTGYPARQMIGKGNYEYALPFYGERRPILVDFLAGWDKDMEGRYTFIKKEGDTLYTETEATCIRGRKRVLWAKASPMRDEEGKISGAIETIRDITELKKTEEDLRASEKRFRHYFDLPPIGFAITSPDKGWIAVNDKLCEILHYSREELYRLTWADLTPSEDLAEEEAVYNQILRGEKHSNTLEKRYIRKDGRIINVEVSAVCARKPDGAADYFLAIVQDITERKRAEEERERLQAQLHHAQKMESVGRLAGGVAHDFNNMLGVIIGHAELAMILAEKNPRLSVRLQEILKAAERSANLTRQLLAFARKQTLILKVLDLNETVEGMLKIIRRLIGENIDLIWQPGKSLDKIHADPSQIDQILANLCVNSRDAIGEMGKVIIETGNAVLDETFCAVNPGAAPGKYVMLSVKDDGAGMDKETLDKLFEPFFTTKEAGKGTGLGLATVYGIVKQNGGFIKVLSAPGEGTTIRIYLPGYFGQEGEPVNKESSDALAAGHETILLVEDEPALLRMSKMMLENLGYRVLAASLPSEAIKLAEEHRGEIQLLMTDIIMPEMNGLVLARNLLAANPNLTCLFMSGYTADVIASHGVFDEGAHFIQKPFTREKLSAKLRESLAAHGK